MDTDEAFLCYLENVTENPKNSNLLEICLEIHGVIKEFSDIFSDPSGLSPQRENDHYIPLQPGFILL